MNLIPHYISLLATSLEVGKIFQRCLLLSVPAYFTWRIAKFRRHINKSSLKERIDSGIDLTANDDVFNTGAGQHEQARWVLSPSPPITIGDATQHRRIDF